MRSRASSFTAVTARKGLVFFFFAIWVVSHLPAALVAGRQSPEVQSLVISAEQNGPDSRSRVASSMLP